MQDGAQKRLPSEALGRQLFGTGVAFSVMQIYRCRVECSTRSRLEIILKFSRT